jgi:hypothetical protein
MLDDSFLIHMVNYNTAILNLNWIILLLIIMKGYFFLAFNILVTFALYSYLYDPAFEYADFIPNTECISIE